MPRISTLFALAFATLALPTHVFAQVPPPAGPAAVGPTRLFFTPTARSLPRGQGTIGLTEIGIPWGEVGLTDHISVLGGGVVPLAIGGIAPKVRLYGGRRVQAAVGVVQLLGSSDTGGVGYGVVTLGSGAAAATIGYGYGYGGLVDPAGTRGILFLGAEKAFGRSLRVILEGYVGGAGLGMPDQTFLGGIRYSRGKWSADLGVVVPAYETGSGPPVPLLTIARAF
jgi:hypothetical protein